MYIYIYIYIYIYNADWESGEIMRKNSNVYTMGNWVVAHAEENMQERSVFKSRRPSCLQQHTTQSKDGKHSILYPLETRRHLMGKETWFEAQRSSLLVTGLCSIVQWNIPIQ